MFSNDFDLDRVLHDIRVKRARLDTLKRHRDDIRSMFACELARNKAQIVAVEEELFDLASLPAKVEAHYGNCK